MLHSVGKSPSRPAGAAQLLSIVLPAYNEQEVLPTTYARFTAMKSILADNGFDYEILFINDGSIDGTADLLNEFALQDRQVRAIHLTRNFGHQPAVTAGLALARGDVVAVMDCDLQDPPEVLPRFLAAWRDGYQVVYAIRANRKEWAGKRLAYWSFYRLLRAISELKIPLDSGDFCIMDRRAVDLLNSLPEGQRFVRGLRTWVGLRQIGISYERDARHAGTPSYNFKALRRLAVDGLVSFSSVPLKMVTRLGVLSGMGAVALGIAVVLARAFRSHWFPPGWSSLACLVLLASSVQLLSLGVIGEYLSRIFIEVKRRPTYLIADVVEQPATSEDEASSTIEPADSDVSVPTENLAEIALANDATSENETNFGSAATETPSELLVPPKFYFVAKGRDLFVRGIRNRVTAAGSEEESKQA